jgi:hypothetical protein
MKLTRFTVPVLAALMLAGPMATPCAAGSDLPGISQIQAETASGWEFSISPLYFWAAGFDGNLRINGTNATIDLTPIDLYVNNLGTLLGALEGYYMGAGEIRYDKFGFFYDVYYIDLGGGDSTSKGHLDLGVDAGLSLLFATMAGTYRVYEDETAHIDALAGLRIWDVDFTLNLDVNGNTNKLGDGDTWVDPVIGVKGGTDISDNVYLKGWAMVGGFGAGSDFMWDVFGGVGYDFNDWISAFAGFRGGGVDYKKGSFKWDVTMYGPMFGLGVKF